MLYVWAIILVTCNLGGLVLTLLQMPGNWLMVLLTVAMAWWQWNAGMFSLWTLGAIVALALAGEIIEFFSSARGARKAGGSRWGSFGSLVGAIAGAIVGTFAIPVPVLGTLAGTCGGAFAGAWAMETLVGGQAKRAVRIGVGAGVGVLKGTAAKVTIGILIWIVVAVAAFVP